MISDVISYYVDGHWFRALKMSDAGEKMRCSNKIAVIVLCQLVDSVLIYVQVGCLKIDVRLSDELPLTEMIVLLLKCKGLTRDIPYH